MGQFAVRRGAFWGNGMACQIAELVGIHVFRTVSSSGFNIDANRIKNGSADCRSLDFFIAC